MKTKCQHKMCRKDATIQVGTVYDYNESQFEDKYIPIFMCTKHASQFIEKFGGR